MSTINNILQFWNSSVQSRARWSKSRTGSLVCATLLAGIALCGSSAKAAVTPYNVLVNPGAETGDLTGWTTEAAIGYVYVVSTNGTMIGVTNGIISTNKYLAHSDTNTFEMFNTTMDHVAIYQEFAAVSNSQWTASCWAICYASNYFIAGANAHMQIVFYDASNNVVPYPPSSLGVFGSQFLDPVDLSGIGVTWTTVPPPATGPSGWLFLQPTNLYTGVIPDVANDQATEANYDSTGYPTNLVAPVGTAKVRYELRFDNTAYGGGGVYFDDCVLKKLNQSDPDITNAPVAVTIFATGSATFSVVGVKAVKLEVLTYRWQLNGENLPPLGNTNGIVGPTTNSTLNLVNCQTNDAGLYSVVVTDTNGWIRSVPVPLTVLLQSPRQKANMLGANASFEGAPFWPLFEPFNGCYFESTNNFYDTPPTIPVNVLDGNWVALIGANGDRDNGFHHAYGTGANCTIVTNVRPGSVWKASGWAYISSTNDFVAGNTCRLQIWFRNALGVGLSDIPPYTPTFESFKIYGSAYTNADMMYTNIDLSSPHHGEVMYHAQLPRDTWCYLPVTNVVNNAGIGLQDDLPVGTWNTGGYFIVPTNSEIAQINFQVYEYCPVAGDNPQPPYLGSAASGVYWDNMELFLVLPVTNLTSSISISGNQFNLSFDAAAGLTYAILYKDNLGDPTWNVLTTVEAPMSWQTNTAATTTTYPLTVSDTLTEHSRFYQVRSQ